MNSDETLVFTPAEVCKLLKISRNTCYAEIHRGNIPHVSFGRRLLIPKAALLQKLECMGNDRALPEGAELRADRGSQ